MNCGVKTLSITTFSITPLSIRALGITIFSIMAECCFAEWHLCGVAFMLNVASNPFILRVIVSVIMLNVVILSVVAPELHPEKFYMIGGRSTARSRPSSRP